VRADAAADRAHVRVERADRHHRLPREPEPLRPLGRQGAERRVGRERVAAQRRLERGQPGVELGEEGIRRIPAVPGVPQGLVPGGATAPLPAAKLARAGQHGRDPVAVLDEGDRGRGHRGIGREDVHRLRPEPLRRVDAAHVPRVVHAAPGAREPGQALGLGDRGVVLPEDEHRVRVVGEPVAESERAAQAIGQHRGRARRVDGDPAHARGDAGPRLGERLAERRLHALEVVERMLAVAIRDGVAVEPFGPAGVGPDRGGQLGAGGRVGDDAANRVGSEVDSNRTGCLAHGAPVTCRGRADRPSIYV